MGLAEIDGYLGGAPTTAPADASGLGKIDAYLGSPASAAPKVPEQYGPAGKGNAPVPGNALLDTLGLSDRPGAVPLTGNDATKTPLGVVLKPKSALEVAAREAVLAPVTAGSLPVRLAATTGLGALDALLSGKGLSGAGYEAALDLIIGGATEAVLGKAGQYATKLSAPLRGFQWATEAPAKALDAVRARLPQGKWLSVPSLSPNKLTVDEAVDLLRKETGAGYQQARQEVAHELTRLDAQRLTGPKPTAGKVFKDITEDQRFEPRNMATQRALDTTAKTLASPLTRAAADVATTTPLDDSGMPAGVVPAMAGAETGLSLLKGIAHKVMH